MHLHRLSKIEVQGFRSFGITRQTPDLASSITVFWGGNSQGKTSYAEALEFLFSGQIARRELLASSKDEFTEALRNAHIKATDTVYVEAHILCSDGILRKLKRTLIDDYKRGNSQGCTSELQLDDVVCKDKDIEEILGIRLSHPPLRAPVLSQHTLGYLFSAAPGDRAAYFRAMLDTQDLEDFRNAVAALEARVAKPTSNELTDLNEVETISSLASKAPKVRASKSLQELTENLSQCIAELLISIGISPTFGLENQIEQIELELAKRRTQTFPLELFEASQFSAWTGSITELAEAHARLLEESAKVDMETQRVLSLYREALALSPHPSHSASTECPLCAAPDTFSDQRISFIREKVRASDAYIQAGNDLRRSLKSLSSQLEALDRSARDASPKFMCIGPLKRRNAGFTIVRMKTILKEHDPIAVWSTKMRLLSRWAKLFRNRIQTARILINDAEGNREKEISYSKLSQSLLVLTAAQQRFVQYLADYQEPNNTLTQAIKDIVDQSADTKGWEGLVRIARNSTGLWNALQAMRAYEVRIKSLKKAVKDIDAANGKVIDEKFTELSDGVRLWWDCLRPDEMTFFSSVQRRGDKTRRNIDLKVGLSASEDKGNPKFRDAVAVFSQSQLHCLGLALFLAKAVQEKVGFVVLDDPVLTSDDDYRPNFVASVIEKLLDAGVQVIICTQDHKSWKDIGDRWRHRGAMQYQMIRNDPVLGTEIRGVNDDLATMIVRAQPLTKSNDPINRKDGAKQIREAMERFCKSLLVKDRKAKGDGFASITDYDGQNLGTYIQLVMNLLSLDPSHPGKLKTAYANVTSGPHDDTPPSASELKMALGDLKMLKREYLD